MKVVPSQFNISFLLVFQGTNVVEVNVKLLFH